MADAETPEPDDKPNRSKWPEVHERALKRMDAIWSVQQAERAECLDDRRFYSVRGAQWDDEVWANAFTNAPKLEINKTHKEVIRILSDYRNNRIAVDFRPKDEGDDESADALDGLYRADWEEGYGDEAADNAFEEKVGGGMGGWRLRTIYEDETDPDNDSQRICREPITDADQRLFFDLSSRRQDKGDAKYAILLTPMDPEAYEEEYPEAAPADFPDIPVYNFQWVQPDSVTIAEYFEVTTEEVEKVILSNPVSDEEKTLLDADEQALTDLKALGWTITRTRKVKKPKVTKYVLSGMEVLKEEEVCGPNIPLVVDYGKRWFVENIERCAGHVRYAKDPQRVYNAMVSQLGEAAGSSPHEKPIFDPEQVKGLENHWAEGNIKRHPYELAHVLRNEDGSIAQAGEIGHVSPTQVPQTVAALLQLAGQDIAEIIGATDQNEEVPANTSAQAIELVHTRADAKTFIYLDNHKKAMRRDGEIWLGMRAEIYIEEGRKLPVLDEQGNRDYVTIGQSVVTKSGAMKTLDLATIKADVIVDIGPSSQTRKDATVRTLEGMALAAGDSDPQLKSALIGTAILNMDGEGIGDIRKWQRMRMVASGIVTPTDDEKEELAKAAQQKQPDPQADFLAAKTQEATASAFEKKAGGVLKVAQAQAVGGPDAAPTPPDGLEQVHKVVQIRKTAAEAEHIHTQTEHLPQELAIEAENAHAKFIAAMKHAVGQ
jgi:hypothetical protein